MIGQLILGIIQGIGEWLPISSEALIVLAQTHFFTDQSLTIIIQQALFLHSGTFLAALIYFRKEIINLPQNKKLLAFLALATLASGSLGLIILRIMKETENELLLTGKTITLATGLLLLVTGSLQLKSKKKGKRGQKDLNFQDGLVLGIVQGLTVLPGLSRSGTTVAALLFLGFAKTEALKISFLMSLPVVFLGNILLNLNFFGQEVYLWGLLTSFIFGYLTIHLLLKAAQKINFGKFIILFGALTILAGFI